MTDYVEMMPFTQRAMLVYTMPLPHDKFDNSLCLEIVYELMLEPWILQSV